VEAAAVVLLCYIAVIDFRTFKIQNSSVLLLLLFYGIYAFIARSQYEILSNIVLGVIMFGFLFWLYTKRVIGGGDVKLVPVVCLWIGTHCALLFSIFLLAFIGIHLIAARMDWAPTMAAGTHRAIPYAPSVAASLICTVLLGCL
jgi:prepilin peptidase CpaA